VDPLPWASLGDKSDVADWIDAGNGADALREVIATAPEFTPAPPAEPVNADPVAQDSEPLPEPPLEVLPAPLADYCAAVAEAYRVHPAMPFAFMLGVASSAIGRAADAIIQPDWREPVPLWVAVIAPPGSVKSHVLKAIATPMFAYDGELQNLHDLAIEAWESECAEINKHSKKSGSETPPARPRRVQAVVSDTTIEALAGVLEVSPRVLGRYDELKGLFDSMGCYKAKGGHDRQTWLSLHNGAEIVVNRKSQRNGEPLLVPCPRLGIVGATTPASAARLVLPEAGDGLLDRFFFVPCPSVKRPWTVPPIPDALKAEWRSRILALCALPADVPRELRFTSEAGEVFGPWFEDSDPTKAPGFMQGVVGKLIGHGGRFAVTLAKLIDPAAEWIEGHDAEAAKRVAEWFTACTFRARQEMLGADAGTIELSDRARRARAWLQRHGRMASELIAGRIPGIGSVEDVKLVWGELETVKLGYRDQHRTTAGREVEVFRLSA
jgi:hypothetical protein